MRDHYEVLGVEPFATAEEIKSAYRRGALKHHPDVNDGDTAAAARFKEIGHAYFVLAYPTRRARYDANPIPRSDDLDFETWWEAEMDRVPTSEWPFGPLSMRALLASLPPPSFSRGAKARHAMPYELTHMHEIELREAKRHREADAVRPARLAFWTSREARSRTTRF